jgi:hypothetical protein
MKRILLLTVSLISFSTLIMAQTTRDSLGGIKVKNPLDRLIKKSAGGSLTTDQIAAGLKEALSVGAERGTKTLSAADGFFGNAAVKILMPEEARKVENTLRSLGLGRQVDDAVKTMNRAAEDAAKSATPIFVKAVKEMSIQDAMGILKGGNNAATSYLQSKTTAQLTEAFRPVINESLQKVDATRYWNTVFTSYNKVSREKINPDLSAYVTEKALSGIFFQLAKEEEKIRLDPVARTSDILKQVFGKQ